MGYYVKGFGEKPLNLKIAKTSIDEIDDGSTPLEAVIRSINYAHKVLNDWAKDKTLVGKNKVLAQKEILRELGKLLMKVSNK